MTETVEVVIRLPKSEYEELTRGGYTWWGRYGEYIKKGTVLPKGHGRLVDADAILEEPYGNTYKDINIAETIIEADKDGQDGR